MAFFYLRIRQLNRALNFFATLINIGALLDLPFLLKFYYKEWAFDTDVSGIGILNSKTET